MSLAMVMPSTQQNTNIKLKIMKKIKKYDYDIIDTSTQSITLKLVRKPSLIPTQITLPLDLIQTFFVVPYSLPTSL